MKLLKIGNYKLIADNYFITIVGGEVEPLGY